MTVHVSVSDLMSPSIAEVYGNDGLLKVTKQIFISPTPTVA